MRDLHLLDAVRIRTLEILRMYGSFGDGGNGMFSVASPVDDAPLIVLATNGAGWDHVSVSRRNRCPNWTEMEHVKRMFFADDETAMELHVPPAEHRNLHPFCLHMWRPNDGRTIPMPPADTVAPAPEQEERS